MASILVDFNRSSASVEQQSLDDVIEREATGNVSTWLRSASAFDFNAAAIGGGNGSSIVAAYLETHLGLRYRSLLESIALTVVYVAILVTGVVGNVCTCLVVAVNGHLHTATNYYLFSLAVSDALTLVLGKMLYYVRHNSMRRFPQQENADW
jgi:hypothetical protein